MTASFRLPNDSGRALATIESHLAAVSKDRPDIAELAKLIGIIAATAIPLGQRLALGAIPGNPAALVGTNESGDAQKALDVAAHGLYMDALKHGSVRSVLSEEAEDVVELNADGRYNVAIDPIDGSGSIGIGAPLGILFCIFPGEGGFLRTGRDILAAGYVSFGHACDIAFSLGEGVTIATLDHRIGTFSIVDEDWKMPAENPVLAYNASNTGSWSDGLQRYIGDCLAGKKGPRGKSFNMRWLAAAVGDLHRILRQGGIFLYPGDKRPGYENGRLRLLYEAFPIAYIVEQAGGLAGDGHGPVLDRMPKSHHEHAPLIFGSKAEMQTLQSYIDKNANGGL
jgi:fructose-1,6-bisphosphatase I